MTRTLFDERLRRLRQLRADRIAGDLFLHDRAFDDAIDRLAGVRRPIRSALLIGRSRPSWRDVLAKIAPEVHLAASGSMEALPVEPHSVDLCICIGEMESANDLPAAAFALRHAVVPGGLVMGSLVGGASLPRLRAAMLAADRVSGNAAARVHPMIDGLSLAALLSSAGLADPVVEVDRVDVHYSSFDRLLGDLRAMGCTNVLADRSRTPLSRGALAAARSAFLGDAAEAIERFELLNFTAWAPEGRSRQFEN